MSYIKEVKNKDGTVSYKARINYKGVFLTKTFPIKANQKKTTKRLAENWCMEIEQKIDEGTYRKEEKRKNYTVKEAIDKYIADGNPKKDESTRRKYIASLEWFKKEIGSIPIRMLERSDFKACRDKLQKKHKVVPIKGQPGNGRETNELISNSCINRYLAYFSTFLSYCVNEYEILDANPMIGAKLKLKENEPRQRWLKELTERQTLLDACRELDYELYLVVLFAMVTGARKSEILNLTWKNTDLENKAIYFLHTKNGEDRTIPIPDVLYTELTALYEQTKSKKVRKIKDDYVFMTAYGKPNYHLIDKLYPKVVNSCRFEKITFHGLRHTYISIASLLGTNQSITKKIVGHKFDSVTGGYTHADCESLREPMNHIAEYMLHGTNNSKHAEIFEENV